MKDLHHYLEDQWRYNNHPKYQKYFEEWFKNLTVNQTHYYKTLWMLKK
jgi:hypothetical protein